MFGRVRVRSRESAARVDAGRADMSVLTLHPTQATADPLALWQAYRRTADARVRDRLVFSLAPLVRHAGAHDDGDIAVGLEALLDVIDVYAPERHGSLAPFAWARVRAALRAR